jgi:hypothetical protein
MDIEKDHAGGHQKCVGDGQSIASFGLCGRLQDGLDGR